MREAHGMATLEQLYDDFEYLTDWEDRYRYVIELGRELDPLADSDRTDANKVRGCASQVWLVSHVEPASAGRPPVLRFEGDSDAHIVRGLIAILFALYSGRSAEDIVATDSKSALGRLGLEEHLSPQRSNGLAAMVERIRSDARDSLAACTA